MRALSILVAAGFLVLSAHTMAAHAPAEAEIMVKYRLHSPHPPTVKVEIRQTAPGVFQCLTPTIPKHRLRAKGFTRLAPPFASSPIAPTCENAVWWLEPGKMAPTASACYEQGRFPVLDQILESCLNI